jgi:hypothetical protein
MITNAGYGGIGEKAVVVYFKGNFPAFTKRNRGKLRRTCVRMASPGLGAS